MSKHTPGPWWLGRDPSHFGSLTSITGGSDSTGGIRSVAEVGGLDIDEAEANARLISAAPDMLEVLKKLDDLRNEWRNNDNFSSIDYMDEIDNLAEDIRAAIAKAEGK